MLTETLFRMTQDKTILKKLRADIASQAPKADLSQMTMDEWRDTLTYEKAANMRFVGMVLYESLRVCAPLKFTTDFCFSEDIEINGVVIKKGTEIFLSIQYLHLNAKEWKDPLKYIPERFDPESPWSLTPSGGKRNPNSFVPFLGGKRLCVGKTFAENIGKVLVSIIASQLEFEFIDPIYLEKSPMNDFSFEVPKTKVRVFHA